MLLQQKKVPEREERAGQKKNVLKKVKEVSYSYTDALISIQTICPKEFYSWYLIFFQGSGDIEGLLSLSDKKCKSKSGDMSGADALAAALGGGSCDMDGMDDKV